MQQRLRNLILKRLQSIRRARREVAGVTFCARTFQKPAHYFCYCPTGPSRKARREAPPRGAFVAWCSVGTFVRLCFGVSCGIARARSFVCDHVRARRGHVVAMAWPSCPGRRDVPGHGLWRGVAVAVAPAVFSSPSCGCDTPMSASVCNGFGVVCVDSICLTFVRRV